MLNVNTITVAGRLTRDPSLKEWTGEEGHSVPVVKLSVAHNPSSAKKLPPIFFDAELWGRGAKPIAERTKKGTAVAVTGQLLEEHYTGKDGVEKRRLKIKATDVRFEFSDENESPDRAIRPLDQVDQLKSALAEDGDDEPPF